MQRTTIASRCERDAPEKRPRAIKKQEEKEKKPGGRYAAWKRALINLRTWKAAVSRDGAVPHLA